MKWPLILEGKSRKGEDWPQVLAHQLDQYLMPHSGCLLSLVWGVKTEAVMPWSTPGDWSATVLQNCGAICLLPHRASRWPWFLPDRWPGSRRKELHRNPGPSEWLLGTFWSKYFAQDPLTYFIPPCLASLLFHPTPYQSKFCLVEEQQRIERVSRSNFLSLRSWETHPPLLPFRF